MTPAPSEPATCRHVTVVGGGTAGDEAVAALATCGITDVRILDDAPANSTFNDATHTWQLRTAAGEMLCSRVVIAAHRPPLTPWIPEFPGRNDFRGASFHAARWDPDFDPRGKRIAVVGADTAAGVHIGRLIESAATVTVFAHAPRRFVRGMPSATTRARRWVGRRVAPGRRSEHPEPALVRSPIAGITASGVRTRDGVEHRVDAIVYGTGYAIRDGIPADAVTGAGGLTIRSAWKDGTEPYFGVAIHGFPNYFVLTGPDIGSQARYISECVRHMQHTASTRVEVRRSSQQVFNERVCLQPGGPAPVAKAFEFWTDDGEDKQTYDGAATLTIAGTGVAVRARLTGQLNPIDGQYHWQGTVLASESQALPDDVVRQSRTVTLTVGAQDAPARLVEKTPWGSHSVAGVGTPPYVTS